MSLCSLLHHISVNLQGKFCIGQSVIISREGLILTLSILPCPQGRIFWSTPCRKIDAERLSVLHQNSGGIGKSIPSALQISLDPRDFPRASPSGNLSGLGKSFGRRGWISQYLPRLGGARIQCQLPTSLLRNGASSRTLLSEVKKISARKSACSVDQFGWTVRARLCAGVLVRSRLSAVPLASS